MLLWLHSALGVKSCLCSKPHHFPGFDTTTLVLDLQNNTPYRRHSKMLILSTDIDKKSLETEFFDVGRQMAIKNIVSSDF